MHQDLQASQSHHSRSNLCNEAQLPSDIQAHVDEFGHIARSAMTEASIYGIATIPKSEDVVACMFSNDQVNHRAVSQAVERELYVCVATLPIVFTSSVACLQVGGHSIVMCHACRWLYFRWVGWTILTMRVITSTTSLLGKMTSTVESEML